ncbi:S-type pyocin domain-containing protein [Pseudomonas putida]
MRREVIVNAAHTTQVKAAAIAAGPSIITGGAGVAEIGALLQQVLRKAITELLDEAGKLAPRAAGTFVTLMAHSPEAGRGSDVVPRLSDRNLQVVVPLEQFHSADPEHLRSLADTQGALPLPYRLRAEAGDDLTSLYLAKTDPTLIPADVPVRHAVWDAEHSLYRITQDGFPAAVLELTLPTDDDNPAPFDRGMPDSMVWAPDRPTVQALPTGATLDFDDMIAVMPPGSSVPHLYLAGTSRYREPGVVSGAGQDLAAGLREQVQQAGSSPIPASIADQLRWNTYPTETDLRTDLWRTLAREQPLVGSLDEVNLRRMQKGYAPVAPREQWVGEQRTLDFDYVQAPRQRGDGFNLDNLRIAKPGTAAHPRPAPLPFVPWSDSQHEVSKSFAAAVAQKIEALKAQRAEQERARLQAQQLAEQLEDRLAFEQWRKAASTFNGELTALAQGPLLLAPAGEIELLENGRQLLANAFTHALGELQQAPANGTTLAMATFASATAHPEAGDDQQLAFSTPLSRLLSTSTAELERLAEAGLGVAMPARIGSWAYGQTTQLAAVSTPTASDMSEVRIRRATLNPLTGMFNAQTDDLPPRYITWTPAVPPGGDGLGIPARPIIPTAISVYSGSPTVPVLPEVETLPAADVDIDDYIFLPDSETGAEPLYWAFTYVRGTYHPPPGTLEAFPAAKRVKPKSKVQNGGKERRRWKDDKGQIFEWDYMHGTVEMYSRRGVHLGEFNAVTGSEIPKKDSKNKPPKRIEL